jgi:hypothetical protein
MNDIIKNYSETDRTLQINSVKRQIGQLFLRVGVMNIKDAISDFTYVEGDFARFCQPLLGLPVSQLDIKYYFTSFDNWQKIIATINPILQQFNWQSEKWDCDKRSYLVTALVALFFGINTIRPLYNTIYSVANGQNLADHYANVFVTAEDKMVLWDVDNGGQYTKVTSNPVVIGNWSYHLKAVR